jgi:pimeloyl-ACP methyl ester carboxylesterase
MYDERPGEVVAGLACPVLYVLARPRRGAGEEERGFYEMKRAAARRLRPLAPRVRVVWLTSIHDIPLERPAELARLIAAFARPAAAFARRAADLSS